jgi:hypothetical protein
MADQKDSGQTELATRRSDHDENTPISASPTESVHKTIDQDSRINPHDEASFLSRIFFLWTSVF